MSRLVWYPYTPEEKQAAIARIDQRFPLVPVLGELGVRRAYAPKLLTLDTETLTAVEADASLAADHDCGTYGCGQDPTYWAYEAVAQLCRVELRRRAGRPATLITEDPF